MFQLPLLDVVPVLLVDVVALFDGVKEVPCGTTWAVTLPVDVCFFCANAVCWNKVVEHASENTTTIIPKQITILLSIIFL